MTILIILTSIVVGLAVILLLIRLSRMASTDLYDSRSLSVLDDNESFDELESIVDNYHQTRVWDEDRLNKLTDKQQKIFNSSSINPEEDNANKNYDFEYILAVFGPGIIVLTLMIVSAYFIVQLITK